MVKYFFRLVLVVIVLSTDLVALDVPDNDAAVNESKREFPDNFYDALDYIDDGNLQKAVDGLKRLLSEYPDDEELAVFVYYNLAVAYIRSNRPYDALDAVSISLDMSPGYATGYFLMGKIYEKLFKINRAVAVYKKSLEFDIDFYESYVQLGNISFYNSKYEEAIDLYKRSLEIKQNNPDVFYNMANCYKAVGEYNTAIGLFSRAIKLKSDDPGYYNNMGTAYRFMGNPKKAIEQFKNALRIKNDYSLSLFNLADLLQSEKRYKDAVALHLKTIKKEPNHPYAYTSLGICYEELGDIVNAIKYYELALKNVPDSEWSEKTKNRLRYLLKEEDE